MMAMKSARYWQIFGFSLASFGVFVLLSCVASQKYKGTVLPVLEKDRRVELPLPISEEGKLAALGFIGAGGRIVDPDFAEEPGQLPERGLLALFDSTHSSDLAVAAFDRNASLWQFFDPRKYIQNEQIVNSCDEEKPPANSRRAYSYRDFWYIFIIDVTDSANVTIPDSLRHFSRVLIMPSESKNSQK